MYLITKKNPTLPLADQSYFQYFLLILIYHLFGMFKGTRHTDPLIDKRWSELSRGVQSKIIGA